jgi:hypothetical protein
LDTIDDPNLVVEPKKLEFHHLEAISLICCELGGQVVLQCNLPDDGQDVLLELRSIYEPAGVEVRHGSRYGRPGRTGWRPAVDLLYFQPKNAPDLLAARVTR